MMNILLKPIVTEKMTSQGDKFNRYGFLVARSANKLQIKKAVEELYSVSVDSVNTMRYGGKIKTRNTKSGLLMGKTSATKKAVVTLKEGNKIDFYSNI
jgi:large subunit ribosomal protein L23